MLGGSGQGEQIAANKVHGVRAALCNDLHLAELSRRHNDANVLAMGGRIVAPALAKEIVTTWLATPFDGGRHARRVEQIGRDRTRGAVMAEGGRSSSRTGMRCSRTDPEVADAIAAEIQRERSTLRLIASENYTSPAVLAALASTMNNKYAEGYPGRRYYGGCEFVDVTETLAIDRAKELFGADHANVQPHAGAQANMAVFGAFLEPRSDDKVLGLVLAHGGHLTHGSPVNVSGMWFDFVGYEVDRETEQLDYDRIRDLAKEHRPKVVLGRLHGLPARRSTGRRSAASPTRWARSCGWTRRTSSACAPATPTRTRCRSPTS